MTLKPYLGFLLLAAATCAASSYPPLKLTSDAPTVYEILQKFGLPSGLLPNTVSYYSLAKDGSFVVELPEPCYIQFEYLVYYKKRITGKLSYSSITDLDGIQVQKLFLWFDVDGIKVDLPPAGSIYFRVGFIDKKLNVAQFETVHSCRKKVSGACGHSMEETHQLDQIDRLAVLFAE